MRRKLFRFELIAVATASLLLALCGRFPLGSGRQSSDRDAGFVSTTATPGAVKWSLPSSETKYLWALEHHSNVLVKFGFGAITRALQEQDAADLARQFAEDFVGSTCDQSQGVELHDDLLTADRMSIAGGVKRSLNADECAEILLALRRRFTDQPRIRFNVKTISPGDRFNLASPWNALCSMRMWGACGSGQSGEVTIVFQASFVQPTKSHMSAPGWLLACDIEQVATSRSSRFLFADVTQAYGIDTSQLTDNWKAEEMRQNTGGLFACDFNRDNCVDLLITDLNSAATTLLQGRPGGGFDDATEAVGLAALRRVKPPFDAAFVDLDNDGWEDLVFSNGAIFKNLEGKSFLDFSSQSNLADVARGFAAKNREITYRLAVADFDRDGWVDIYVVRSGGLPTSWLDDTLENPVDNLLLRNLGNWQFRDVTDTSQTTAAALSAFTAVWFDANNDLWPDLYVINEYGDGLLYINEQNGSFRETDIDPSNADFGSMGVASGDIDNDGNIDLYIASMYSKAGSRVIGNLPPGVYPPEVMAKLRRLISGSEFYQNAGNLRFRAAAEDLQIHDVGWAWGPTLADFNNDGLLDVFAPAGYMSRDRTKPDG